MDVIRAGSVTETELGYDETENRPKITENTETSVFSSSKCKWQIEVVNLLNNIHSFIY
jgi:hypothetical protein